MDLYRDLIGALGEELHIVLESRHYEGPMQTWWRQGIEQTLAQSACSEFEDLLLNDGCVGISALDAGGRISEVAFPDHKYIAIYDFYLDRFEEILKNYGIPHLPDLRRLDEFPHTHHSHEDYTQTFESLRERLGADELETDEESESDEEGDSDDDDDRLQASF